MPSNSNKRILQALSFALRPLASALMLVGIDYRDFAEAAKDAFVGVASDNYGKRNNPASTSRISVKTGLTRVNVRQVRERISAEPVYSFEDSLLPAQIINRWFADPAYLDKNGQPLALRYTGNDPSFVSLATTFNPVTSVEHLLEELVVSDTVVRNDDDTLTPVVPYYRPHSRETQLERALAQPICALLTSINRNLSVDRSDAWIERFAFVKTADTDGLTKIRQFARERSKNFIVSSNDLFTALEAKEGEDLGSDVKSVGVCAFYFEQEPMKVSSQSGNDAC